MSRANTSGRSGGLIAALSAIALALAMCTSPVPTSPAAGSETHFLSPCEAWCATGAECICGVCTMPCLDSLSCATASAVARCSPARPRVATGRCSADAPAAFCDAVCLSDDDCATFGAAVRCEDGYCRAPATQGVSGDAGAGVCAASGVTPDEVLVLGDSYLTLTTFPTRLEAEAIASGWLPSDSNLRQQASGLSSRLADGTYSIGAQYASATEVSKPRVVIMDGGETDMFEGLCATVPASNCANVQAAVEGAISLLQTMATDGVEHVVYFFYPDPIGNPGLKQALDVLRPLVRNVCGNAPLPCHWVDLRPVFAEHPEYVASDGMLFSDDGARASAQSIWARVRERCILP